MERQGREPNARVESSAVGMRIEAPRRVWSGEGVPSPDRGEVWEWGCAPFPENFSGLGNKYVMDQKTAK